MEVFLTGATGYIGGTVAVKLMMAGHHVRGLVRDGARAGQLAASGVEPVVGSLADAALLAAEAKRADAVINAADMNHRAAVETMLDALAGSNKRFVHTSGSGLIGDAGDGESRSDIVFDETTPYMVAPAKAARVALHQLIRDASLRGVHTSILCNSLIYGDGLGLHRDSVQLPTLLEQAKKSGVVRYVGRGLNVWSNVHIEDAADLHLLALDRAPAGSLYFVENGEASFAGIAQALADRLQLGSPKPWTMAEAIAHWGAGMTGLLASNSRVTAALARAELGWQPRHASVMEWIAHEMTV